jgi:hypothetical protein
MSSTLPEKPEARPEVKVFGVDLTSKPQHIQFAVLGGGALISALTFAFLQEKVRHNAFSVFWC